MKERVSIILSKLIYALSAGFFIWTIAAIFMRNYYSYNSLALAGAAVAYILLIALMWMLFKKKESFIKKRIRYFTLGFFLLMGIVQIIMIFILRYTPKYDIGSLFNGARDWALTGDFSSYYTYFGMFHNNWGGLVLLRIVFGLANLLGITKFFFVASLLNSALSLSSMYLTGSVCGKLYGERGRIMTYLIYMISLPFYFIAPAFYTDALSMVFPVLILRLYIAAREQEKPISRLALFALMGLAAGVGYGIKATIAITLIAIILEAVLFRDFKKYIPLIPISVIMALVCSVALNGIIYRHVDRKEAENLRIPILHWVMMGTTGSGMYKKSEYEFTKSFDDPAARKDAVAERLITRLKTYSFKDYSKLFTTKLNVDFGDGTYGLSDCLGCPHGDDNFFHSFLVKGGERYDVYKHICTGVLMAIYAVITLSCVLDVIGKNSGCGLLVPRLAILGLFLFLLFWEARWRYFSNYVPLLIFLAVAGLEGIFSRIKDWRGSQADSAI